MVDSKELSDDEAFELRVQEVLDQLGECTEHELDRIKKLLKRGVPGPFVVDKIAHRRAKDAADELRSGLWKAGLLVKMTDEECGVAINAVNGGSAVNDVIEMLRSIVEARINASPVTATKVKAKKKN